MTAVAGACVVCKTALGAASIKLRYEGQSYAFDRDLCKRIFQENPDRYLDADGGVLPQPR